MFKTIARAVAALTALAAEPSAAGLVRHTGAFLASPTNLVTFAAMGDLASGVAWLENGVSVQAVGQQGTATSGYGFANGGKTFAGRSGADYGYTSIKLQNGGTFDGFQFSAASTNGGYYTSLNFEALLNGVVIDSGNIGTLGSWWDTRGGSDIFGLSGAMFDEIRLQSTYGPSFNATGFTQLIIDNLGFSGVAAVVPEPGMLLLSALGAACLGARRRFRLR